MNNIHSSIYFWLSVNIFEQMFGTVFDWYAFVSVDLDESRFAEATISTAESSRVANWIPGWSTKLLTKAFSTPQIFVFLTFNCVCLRHAFLMMRIYYVAVFTVAALNNTKHFKISNLLLQFTLTSFAPQDTNAIALTCWVIVSLICNFTLGSRTKCKLQQVWTWEKKNNRARLHVEWNNIKQPDEVLLQ